MPSNTLANCGKMTGSSFYLDTAPFIYLIEGNEVFMPKVAKFLSEGVFNGANFATSVLTTLEFNVKPLQLHRNDILVEFDNLLRELNFNVSPVTLEIAHEAAHLRAAYPVIKAMDALHLSTAKVLGCNVFLTNDKQLTQVKEVEVLLLSAL